MAEVVLFHHVLGLTEGVRGFAAELAGDRHIVHTPDPYNGATATSLEDGFAIKNSIGDEVLAERTRLELNDLPAEIIFAGISLGVMAAQHLAQTQPGALGPCSTKPASQSPGSRRSARGPTGFPCRSTA